MPTISDPEGPQLDLIWAREERPARGPRPPLSREQIVAAAIEIADAAGLKAVSMRRIAATLGVGTMSLYWHVTSKDDLLELISDAALGEIALPARPSGDWRADLGLLAREYRATLLRHPWLATLSGECSQLGPGSLRQAEFLFAALDGLGLDRDTIFGIVGTLDTYVMGFVLRELAEEEIIRRVGLDKGDWFAAIHPYLRQALAGGQYPTLGRFIDDETAPPHSETHFAFGLDCLLDGIAARIGGAGRL